MDISMYLTAAQVADFAASSKALEELIKVLAATVRPDFSSHTIDPSLLNRVW
jgi:hypothetical protein